MATHCRLFFGGLRLDDVKSFNGILPDPAFSGYVHRHRRINNVLPSHEHDHNLVLQEKGNGLWDDSFWELAWRCDPPDHGMYC